MADNRCIAEDCEKFALLGKEHCYEHVPGKEEEPVEEIPQRFLDRDPDPANWKRYELPVMSDGEFEMVKLTQFLECPYCAGMVHEESAKWHSKYHQSLNDNMKAIYQGIENAAYSR